MPRKQFTPEQKREYFAGLRNQGQAAKALAAADDSIGAMYTQTKEKQNETVQAA